MVRLKNELGWEPSLQFEEGLQKTIQWYMNNQQWIDNVTSGDYQKYYASTIWIMIKWFSTLEES